MSNYNFDNHNYIGLGEIFLDGVKPLPHRTSSIKAVQAARRETENAAKIAAALDEWGDDPFEDGTVLSYSVQFTPDGKWYDFVWLRCQNGVWYSTGRSVFDKTWDSLVAHAVQHGVTPHDTFYVTEWEAMAE